MVVFNHLDAGTPEEIWQAEERLAAAPALDTQFDRLVVVAAHPDDETLGAGGLIRRAHDGGARITIVVATDGEASHPGSPSHAADELRPLRRSEVLNAVRVLAPDAEVHFLGLGDGELAEDTAAFESAIDSVLAGQPSPARGLIVAPWSGDGHRDHRVTAEVVARIAARRGLRHLGYPIWLWHWGRPEDVPWEAGTALSLTPAQRTAKAEALRAHLSQLQPLSEAPGDEAIVSESMQAHFARDIEFFLAESPAGEQSLPAEWFEDFYTRHEDPWGFETRWYEERKRATLLAALPSRALGSVLEIGCATGLITRDLAARASHVLGLDASAVALAAAQERVGELSAVTLRQGVVPADWPAGAYDTIVFSEVGYYLSSEDLERTVSLMEAALTPDGCLVACHWRHPVAEYPLTGDDVHRVLGAVAGWERLARHEEEDFLLEVFCRKPAVSVARREGLR